MPKTYHVTARHTVADDSIARLLAGVQLMPTNRTWLRVRRERAREPGVLLP